MPLPARAEDAAETMPTIRPDPRQQSGDTGPGSNAGPLLRGAGMQGWGLRSGRIWSVAVTPVPPASASVWRLATGRAAHRAQAPETVSVIPTKAEIQGREQWL
jgi:hypothetical protein